MQVIAKHNGGDLLMMTIYKQGTVLPQLAYYLHYINSGSKHDKNHHTREGKRNTLLVNVN
jgi:hypothetical protein